MTKSESNERQPGPGESVRRLLRAARTATLGTLLGPDNWPYGSLVLLACEPDSTPILLMSTLAEHTRNIVNDARVSLLVDGTQDLASPLTGARATFLGRAEVTQDKGARTRFLSRHPDAAGYADFRDFSFYRIKLERAHLVAGFGRIHWIDAKEVLRPAPAALSEAESDIVEHMNADHGEALDLYANRLLGVPGAGWRMTGVDAEGCDIIREGKLLRLDFAAAVNDPEEARRELVRLVKAARAAA